MTAQENTKQPEPGSPRTCLLVLGMHRSGTSALARAVNLLGAALPNNLMPPAPDNNEAGFWEPARLVALHDRMLAEAGSSWDDWRKFDPASLPPERVAHYTGEIARLIEEEYGEAALFVVKDPRICRFVPLYDDALAAIGCEPRAVIMVRNPLEVAASLEKRDAMAHDRAALLWLRHVLDAEAATRGRPRAFLSYDDLLADWKTALGDLATRLGVAWPRAIGEVAGEIGEFVTPAQRHHEIAPDRLHDDPATSAWIADSYAALGQLEHDPASAEACGELDRISREFDNAAPVIARAEAGARESQAAREVEARQHEAALAGQAAALSEATARAEMLAGQVKEREAALAGQTTALSEATARAEMLAGQVKEREAALAGQTTALSEATGRAEMLKGQLGEQEAELAGQAAALSEATARAETLAGQLKEREAEIGRYEQAIYKADLLRSDLESHIKSKDESISDLLNKISDVKLENDIEVNKLKLRMDSELSKLNTENSNKQNELLHLNNRLKNIELKYNENLIEVINLTERIVKIHSEKYKKYKTEGIKNMIFDKLIEKILTVLTGRDFRRLVFTFTPERDLRLSNVHEGAWEAIGNDPIFHLHEAVGARPRGWMQLSIDIEALNESRPNPSIYIDDKLGYREETRVKLPFDGKKVITKVINFPNDTISLRFDPADGPCTFRLHGATAKPLTKFGLGARLLGSAIRRQRAKGRSYSSIARHGLGLLRNSGWQAVKNRLVDSGGEVDLQSSYSDWLSRRGPEEANRLDKAGEEIPGFSYKPVFSIVMPTYNTPEKWLVKAIESVRAQIYAYWELCICDDASTDPRVAALLKEYAAKDQRIKLTFRETNGHISRASNDAMELMTGEFMCLMDHDDEIAPNALYEFAKILNEDQSVEFIYSDEDKISINGQRYEPFFKPEWSPSLLESCMYTAHFACYRNDIVRKTGGFRPECNGAQDYDFVLRFTEHVSNVRHVPRILYHWRAIPGSTAQTMDNKSYVIDAALRALTDRCKRTGEPDIVKPAEYAGSFIVRRKIVGTPLISIVIPSAGRDAYIRGRQIDLLANCIDSIQKKSTYRNFEIIVVDNGDLTKVTKRRIKPFGIKFVTYSQPTFNVAAKMNLGAKQATGNYVLFLNDDIEVISDDWLEAMLAAAQMPGVGMVGAKLRFEDGSLQHVGVTSSDGWPDHLRRGYPADDPGYFFSSVTTREVLAVTGACALMPLDLFWQVGGFNEDFAVNYNDIDLCVKVRNSGKRILQTSQAQLFHFESLNRVRTVDESELHLWEKLNGDQFKYDPYYSPIMAISPPSYEPDFANRGAMI